MKSAILVRILVVDDSTNLRQVIIRYLNLSKVPEYEFSFFEAANGSEAEQVLQECSAVGEPIDVIFLDWMMPTMTGHQFLTNVRSIEKFKHSPQVIMLTAETNSEQIND